MNRPNYTAIFFFMSRYKLIYIGILAVTIPVSILEGLSVAAFFPLFSTMLSGQAESNSGILRYTSFLVDLIPGLSGFAAAAAALVAIFVIKTVGILVRDLMVAFAGAKILYSVKQQIMERYSVAEYEYMLDNQQGAMIYSGLSAPGSVSALHMTLSRFVTSLLKVISITVILISLQPVGAISFMVLGVIYYLGIHYLSRKVSFNLGQGRVAASTEQTVIANEFLNGFRQIISFNTAKRWVARFDRENRIYSELYAKDLAWQAVPRPLLELSTLGMLVGFVLLLTSTSGDNLTKDLASLGVFAVALVQLLPSLNAFGGTRLQIMSGLPNVQIAHQILTQAVPIRHEGDQEIGPLNDGIVFENVTFAHKNRDTLMDGVDMSFKKGEITAIVGPSGSGKTTLINLILGLFEPSSGKITADGVPLRDLTHETWLGRIGFVSQDPFIYNTTIKENIEFSRAGYSMDDIKQAAAMANADNFISDHPDGYDTIVGDRGIKLSGGQQQRICIARALLASPEILIFDEATSSLDSLSEKQVQMAIDDASADRTVIIIAHRLSTIRNADKIIVLDGGKIVEQGTHQDLLGSKGHYSRQVAASTHSDS